jgi:hypothetical protein
VILVFLVAINLVILVFFVAARRGLRGTKWAAVVHKESYEP